MKDCSNREPINDRALSLPTCRLFGIPCGLFSGVGVCWGTKTPIKETVAGISLNGYFPAERAEFRAAVEKMLD